MTKTEFLYNLKEGLSAYPEEEIIGYIDYYSEIIDDRIEDGVTEEDAVAHVGTPDEIINRIIAETPLPKLVKTKLKREVPLKPLAIVLIVLGSPVWLSILISILAVFISLLAAVFSVIISLYAIAVSLAACGIAGIIATIPMFIVQTPLSAFAALGAGLFCAGAAILMFMGCNAAAKFSVKLIGRFSLWIKSLFVRKENAK